MSAARVFRKRILTLLHPSVDSGTCWLCSLAPSGKDKTRRLLVHLTFLQTDPWFSTFSDKHLFHLKNQMRGVEIAERPGVHTFSLHKQGWRRRRRRRGGGGREEVKLMATYAITYSTSGIACSY